MLNYDLERTSAGTEVERDTQAAWLLDSLPPHGHEDASAEGIEEAARRREELGSGQVQPLSSDEFWDSIYLADAILARAIGRDNRT